MRSLLILALAAAPFMAVAADNAAPAPAADVKAVNTVCVVCGNPVDPKVAPVDGKTADGKVVHIGCCSDKCAAEVKKSPDIYVEAATQNKKFDSKHPPK